MTTVGTLIETANAKGAPLAADLSSVIRRKMPGLDCLRGIAISGVVIYHGFGGSVPPSQLQGWRQLFARATLLGRHGVPLFFVLSGFLITGILLDVRKTKRYYYDFYMRRFLRIVPAYLATLALLKLFSIISWGYLAIALSYLTNVSSLFHHENEYGPLWSLSVEEQFYLLWPWVVRRISRNAFIALCAFLICCSPLLRLAVLTVPSPFRDVHTKTPLILDTFAAGALVAVIVRSPVWNVARLRRLGISCTAGGMLLVISFLMTVNGTHDSRYWAAFELCPYIVLFSGTVAWAVASQISIQTPFAKLFSFLGYISYGLYLIHQFTFHIYDLLCHNTWCANIAANGLLWTMRFVVCSAVSIFAAWLSRSFFEQRFLNLKKRYAPSGSEV